MPICPKCQEYFPTRTIIDGRRVMLNARKYCLKCSPFGAHNTKKLEQPSKRSKSCKSCKSCGRPRTWKGKSSCCSACDQRKRRERRMERLIKRRGGKCCLCGYSRCSRALSFHHVDPSTKKFGISASLNLAWATLVKEADKCVLLCMNCHHELHAGFVTLPDHVLVSVAARHAA